MIHPAVKATVLIVLLTVCGSGCDSAEKYQKSETTPASVPEQGTLKLAGTPAQMAWARDVTNALNAAQQTWDRRDSLSAIATADSLIHIVEAALDTLPPDSALGRFAVIYVSDVYGRLRAWHLARGDNDAVAALAERYQALAARLEMRRDTTQATP